MPFGKYGYAYTFSVEHGAGLFSSLERGIFHGTPLEEMNNIESTGTNELKARGKSLELTQYGERIRQVRSKRKLSQGEFAELAGVTVRAQRNYEAGLRTPNLDYLSNLAIAGVDVGYILTGLESMIDEKADADAFRFMSEHLGLPHELRGDFSFLISEFRRGKMIHDDLNQRLANCLSNHRIDVIDAGLLASILEEINLAADHLPARKKAGVASLLYRAFRASGRIDMKAVKEAVDLAS